jgi:hypothetical protein
MRLVEAATRGPDKPPLRRLDLLARDVDGETVVLDRNRRMIHHLNATASLIWERCNGDQSSAEIAAAIAEAFEVDVETAGRDVARILREFTALGLLEVLSTHPDSPGRTDGRHAFR